MKTRTVETTKKARFAWALLGLGLLLFILGEVLRSALPASAFNFKIASGLGILAFGLGLAGAARSITARFDPKAARRMAIEESDERMRLIRDRAGSSAFSFSIILSSLILVIYSGMTAGRPGFDPLWWVLAFLVIAPGLWYVAMLFWINKRS